MPLLLPLVLPPETHASWLKAHRAEWLLRAQEGLERGRDISLLERLEAGLEAGVR